MKRTVHDKATVRAEVSDFATAKCGKSFGPKWNKCFYEKLKELKERTGENYFLSGEEEYLSLRTEEL